MNLLPITLVFIRLKIFEKDFENPVVIQEIKRLDLFWPLIAEACESTLTPALLNISILPVSSPVSGSRVSPCAPLSETEYSATLF